MKKKTKKKRNPADATMRNVKPIQKRVRELEERSEVHHRAIGAILAMLVARG